VTLDVKAVTWPLFGSAWDGADKIKEDTANNFHDVYQEYTGLASVPHTFSVFAKAAERDWIHLAWWDYAGNVTTTFFNVTTGVKGTSSVVGAGTIIDYDIEPWANGYYRVWMAVNCQANTSHAIQHGPAQADGVDSYAGTTGWGAYFIGSMVERGTREPTSYIFTLGASGVRGADLLTYPAAGNIPNAGPCTIVLWANSNFLRNGQLFSSQDAGSLNGCAMFTGVYNGVVVGQITTGVVQAAMSQAVDQLTAGGPLKKFALSYDLNDAEWYTSDVSRDTDGTVALPTNAFRIAIGMAGNNVAQLNGHAQRLRIFNRRLTLSEIKLVT
jgi:hypothetical protein